MEVALINVFDKITEDGKIHFDEYGRDGDIPYQFAHTPSRGDVILLDDIYYSVILIQFKGSGANGFFFAERIFLKKIGVKDDLREFMKSEIKKML